MINRTYFLYAERFSPAGQLLGFSDATHTYKSFFENPRLVVDAFREQLLLEFPDQMVVIKMVTRL
jgi:hypothetical protein